jgi:hypothetical protein
MDRDKLTEPQVVWLRFFDEKKCREESLMGAQGEVKKLKSA